MNNKTTNNTIIEKARKEFLRTINKYGKEDPYGLKKHVIEAEKWAKKIIKKKPEVDPEIILLAVWLHDIGHYPIPTNKDHAIRSEERAKKFLKKIKYPEEKAKEVLHCVRAHRCKDVIPKTTEAKIVALVDSASHMTDTIYLDMAKDDKEKKQPFRAYDKIERDYRDLKAMPEIRKELKKLYEAWKKLIKAYEEIKIE